MKVGSQVSGIISALHVDFNSQVTTGQLLAELDATPFQATVDQRRADLQRAEAELRNATLAFERAKRLTQEQIHQYVTLRGYAADHADHGSANPHHQ